MSYELYIFHSLVKDKVDAGLELDAFEHPSIASAEISTLVERLHQYGYEQNRQNQNEFSKNIDACPIQVRIFNSEISFSIPYWEGADEAIFEAIQDASELADSDNLVMFDPQTEEWSIV